MNYGKILVLAIFLASAIASASAANNVTDFYYNISAPDTPAGIGDAANQVTGGLAGVGILMSVWIVFFSMPNRRGYDTLASAISANIVTTGIALILYPLGWLSGEAMVLMFTLTAGSLAYSVATS